MTVALYQHICTLAYLRILLHTNRALEEWTPGHLVATGHLPWCTEVGRACSCWLVTKAQLDAALAGWVSDQNVMELVCLHRYVAFLDIASNSVFCHHSTSAAIHQFDLFFLILEPLSIFHEWCWHTWDSHAIVLEFDKLLLEFSCFLYRIILWTSVWLRQVGIVSIVQDERCRRWCCCCVWSWLCHYRCAVGWLLEVLSWLMRHWAWSSSLRSLGDTELWRWILGPGHRLEISTLLRWGSWLLLLAL